MTKTINPFEAIPKPVLDEVDSRSKEQLLQQLGLVGLKSGRKRQRGGRTMISERGRRGGSLDGRIGLLLRN